MEYLQALNDWFHVGMLWLVYGLISIYIFVEHIKYSEKIKQINHWYSLLMGLTWFIWIPICLLKDLLNRLKIQL